MQGFSFRDVAFVSAVAGGTPVPSDPIEDWESYSLGDATTQTLGGGSGWSGDWVTRDAVIAAAREDWESYSLGDATVQTLNGGAGWSGNWVTRT
jgi:hypothetical protein